MLCDREIAALDGMIVPFVGKQVREENGKPVISYGLSSAGYDIRLGTQFRRPKTGRVLDPKHIREDDWTNEEITTPFLLAPNSFILGRSLETFTMPDDVQAECLGKSKIARVGGFLNVTPAEPGWNGTLTLEIANLGYSHLVIYPGEGIAQLVFTRLSQRPMVTYADRAGVFQGQVDVTLSRL